MTPLVTHVRAFVASLLTPVRNGWRTIVHEPFSGAWQRNLEWRTETVLAHHAVYACVNQISKDIGKLRPRLIEWDDSGEVWTETEIPAFSGVLNQPNRYQNYQQFQAWWTTSKLIWGNTYALKIWDGRGTVEALHILDPSRVTVLVAPDGTVFYNLKQDNLAGLEAEEVAVPAAWIVHDRINCLFHPLVGTSPIYACGAPANMGLHIEKNSTKFFGNGSNPTGILSPLNPITPAKADELMAKWNARFGRDGPGGVALLPEGMKFEAMRVNATDSQLLQQLEWTAQTVCSVYGVPPWKIHVGEQPAYTSPEISNNGYYTDCLQSHVEQYEICMDEALGIRKKKIGVNLDLAGLARMDQTSQVKSLVEGIRGGLYTPNGARRMVDLPPVKGGDTIWLQQQDVPIEIAYENAVNPPEPPAALPAPEPPKLLAPPSDDPEETERNIALLIESSAYALEANV